MLSYKYCCEHCVIHTNSRQTYNRHLLSKRHANMQSDKNSYNFSCEKCKKKFKGNSGLWRHMNSCKVETVTVNATPDIYTQTIKDAVKECMNELKYDIKNELKTNQHPTNITNNQHNTFNVNLFLNENATKAKNFIDMIQNISVKGPYPETISSENYVSNVVKMITNEIDKIPIDERPIHCIKDEDENQKILHIRHKNKWEKEVELDWTKQIHNRYHDIGDEPTPEEEKIIFNSLKQLEENIKTEIEKLNRSTVEEYKYEYSHPINRVSIITCLLDYVNIEKDQLLKIIEKAYKNRNQQVAT